MTEVITDIRKEMAGEPAAERCVPQSRAMSKSYGRSWRRTRRPAIPAMPTIALRKERVASVPRTPLHSAARGIRKR